MCRRSGGAAERQLEGAADQHGAPAEQVHATKENLYCSASALVQSMSYLPGWSEKNFQVGSWLTKGVSPCDQMT